MKCPACEHDAPDSADSCFNCGHSFRSQVTLKRGSMVAGRYEVLAPLGQGGMGTVYKARDHVLEETVALKVLRADVRNDPDMERRFRTEIRLARRVRHRNVCGIHEYGEEGGLRYIAMEYIEGIDLRKVLTERGPLPPDQAFEACIRVAEGLQAIHEAGIIHRDLKTANLMVDGQGVVRLMDFGIAKQIGSEAAAGATATGLIVGTPEYMSPEQARGDKLDPRSDVYALGIVAFELFTGKVPFRGQTPMATIFKHLQDAPPFEGPAAAALPREAVPVVRRALAKTADERHASAIEFAHAMVEAREAAGIPPPATGPLTPRPGLTASASATTLRPPPPTIGHGPTPTRLPAAPRRPDPPPTALLPTRADQPAARPGLSRAAIAAGSAAVLLLAAGGAWIATRGAREAAAPPMPSAAPSTASASAAPAVPAASAANGMLVIDALPWGEVAEVVDASGLRRAIGGAPDTPLALELPPGEYTVRVRNPAFAEALALTATVKPGAVERRLVEFRRVDAADYFRKTGS
jgi:eukaryotic-like serine/threonine-protein kinase